jgi:hypothetical protein
MTLLDLRRYAVRETTRIHFHLEPAGECIVNEDGILKIPSLHRVPDFRIDSALPGVDQFTLARVKGAVKPRSLSRAQLEALLGAPAGAAAEPEE